MGVVVFEKLPFDLVSPRRLVRRRTRKGGRTRWKAAGAGSRPQRGQGWRRRCHCCCCCCPPSLPPTEEGKQSHAKAAAAKTKRKASRPPSLPPSLPSLPPPGLGCYTHTSRHWNRRSLPPPLLLPPLPPPRPPPLPRGKVRCLAQKECFCSGWSDARQGRRKEGRTKTRGAAFLVSS